MGEEPDLAEAAAYIQGERPSLEEEHIWSVLMELGDPPGAGAEGLALDAKELWGWLDERMPYFAVPRYIRVVDTLPKTPTERVRKVELREHGITPDTYDRSSG